MPKHVDRQGRPPIVRGSRTGRPSARRIRAAPGLPRRARQPISVSVMFAVIRTGGKQYKVANDDVIAVEKLAGEPGATIELGEVLMVGDGAEVSTGTPLRRRRLGQRHLVEQTPRRQDHRLQEEAAAQLPPQERPSPASDRAADHRDPRRRTVAAAAAGGAEMAHKKAGGSSRNGRDSRRPAARRQEIRRRDRRSRQHHRAPARHQVSSRRAMSAWAATTRCSRCEGGR